MHKKHFFFFLLKHGHTKYYNYGINFQWFFFLNFVKEAFMFESMHFKYVSNSGKITLVIRN